MPPFTYFMFISYALNHIYSLHCQLLTITQFIIIKHLPLSLPQPTPKFFVNKCVQKGSTKRDKNKSQMTDSRLAHKHVPT